MELSLDAKNFYVYLTTKYKSRLGQPLNPKTAFDAISRCRRVEKILGMDLDQAIKIIGMDKISTEIFKNFQPRWPQCNGINRPYYPHNDYLAAARRYQEFIEGK